MAETRDERDDEDKRALEARLRTLKDDIAAERSSDAPPSEAQEASPMAQGMKGASELIAAVLVGAAIGWGADRLAGTRPLFFIVFFFIGVAAGVLNLVRAVVPKPPK